MTFAWLDGFWRRKDSTAATRGHARIRGRGQLRMERLETKSFLVGVAFGGLEMGLETSLDAFDWDVAPEECAEVESFDWWMTDAESSEQTPMEFPGVVQGGLLPRTPAPWMTTWGDDKTNLDDDPSATDWAYPFMGNESEGDVSSPSESFCGFGESLESPVDTWRGVCKLGYDFFEEVGSDWFGRVQEHTFVIIKLPDYVGCTLLDGASSDLANGSDGDFADPSAGGDDDSGFFVFDAVASTADLPEHVTQESENMQADALAT